MKEQGAKNQYRVSDALWEKIEPLLPKHPNTHRFGGGRPRVLPARRDQAMDGIFFVLRTGREWNALNATGIPTGALPICGSRNGQRPGCSGGSGR